MQIATQGHLMAGAVALTTTALFAAGVEKTAAVGIQQDIVIEGGGLEIADPVGGKSIIIDEDWARHEVVPNRVFVKFRQDVAPQGREDLLAEMDAEISSSYERMLPRTHCLAIPGGVADFLERYRFRGDVLEYIEPVYVLELHEIPNDAGWSQLYGMDRINAPGAWDQTTGDQDFTIAIIDSGADPNHPDLAPNLWQNPGEIIGNGIDDDGNGLVDDSYGWDFYDGDSNPADQNGHGTHTAGTVGARGDNGIGVVGVNWECSLMIFRVGDQFLSSQAILDSLQTACINGAKVSNNSYGGGGFSSTFSNLIRAAGDDYDHIFCASAGNDGSSSASYPAAYDHFNIISVAATNSSDARASFSQYGSNVDIGAPGVGILSTIPGNSYANFDGTSMASPHVAGAAALLYSVLGDVDYEVVVNLIYDNVRPVSGLNGLVVTGGVLDVDAALENAFIGPELSLGDVIPAFIPAGEELTLAIDVDPRQDSIVPGSPNLLIDFGSGAFQGLPLTQTGASRYEVTLPAAECDWNPRFYFSVRGEVVGLMNLPEGGAADTLSFSVGEEVVVLEDDANADGQWTIGLPSDTASTGQWTRGNPNGTDAQPENAASGANCFFTGQGSVGGGLGENDVDDGFTTLISPSFDGAAVANSVISYRRWYSNDTGSAANSDVMEIDISNDGGSTWQTVETVSENAGVWVTRSFDIASIVTPTDDMKIRFIASDLGEGSLVEAAIDLLVVGGVECIDNEGPTCLGDLNGDGLVNGEDVGLLLGFWGSSEPVADLDGDGTVGGGDVGLILGGWGLCL